MNNSQDTHIDISANEKNDQEIDIFAHLKLFHARIALNRIIKLKELFGSVTNIVNQQYKVLEKTHILQEKHLELLFSNTNETLLKKSLNWLKGDNTHDSNLTKNNIEKRHIITFESQYYPELLKNIASPPSLLFLLGNPSLLSEKQIGIVGTRVPTHSGIKNSEDFALSLSKNDFVITSGMAKGIDTFAHQGALKATGKTIAVLGTGIDIIYPKENKALMQQIASQGAVISEFALGSAPTVYNFPRRNRLISGLSQGILVIEADIKSGALVTARFALEQGRDIFAIPGSIHNPQSKGCHHLIKQGAKLTESVQDITEDLGYSVAIRGDTALKLNQEAPKKTKNTSNKALTTPNNKPNDNQLSLSGLSENASKILHSIDYDPTDIDSIIERTNLPIDIISEEVLLLEISSLIKGNGGKYLRI